MYPFGSPPSVYSLSATLYRIQALLTRGTPGEREPLDLKYYIGFISLQQEVDGWKYWQRLGFCAWEVEHVVYDGHDTPEKIFLEGESD